VIFLGIRFRPVSCSMHKFNGGINLISGREVRVVLLGEIWE
jgi:hypothetical protein